MKGTAPRNRLRVYAVRLHHDPESPDAPWYLLLRRPTGRPAPRTKRNGQWDIKQRAVWLSPDDFEWAFPDVRLEPGGGPELLRTSRATSELSIVDFRLASDTCFPSPGS